MRPSSGSRPGDAERRSALRWPDLTAGLPAERGALGVAGLAAALAWAPGSAVAAAAGAVALAAALRWPALAVAAAVALVPFGSRLAVPLGPASATPPSPLVALALAGAVLGHLGLRRWPRLGPGAPAVLAAAAAWLAVVAASAVGAPSTATAALEVVRWGVFAAAVALAASLTGAAGRRQAGGVVAALLAAGAAEALVGGRWALDGVGPGPFQLPGGRARAFGDFGQPNPFGGYMNLVWPLAAALVVERAWPRRWPPHGGRRAAGGAPAALVALALPAAAACLGGLVLSWSRGAWLAAAAAVGAMAALRIAAGWREPRDRLALVGPYLAVTVALAAVVTGAAPGVPAGVVARAATITGAAGAGAARRDLAHADVTGANFSTIERLAHWDAALRMAADRPWLGQGPGHYALRYQDYRLPRWPYDLGHAHNAYLHTLAETGVAGLLACAALFATALALAVRAAVAPRGAYEGALGLGVAGSLTATAVHSLFDLLWVHDMTVTLAVLVGLVLAARTWPGAAPAAAP